MIKLLIFDFDGTLVDTALDIMNAANKLLVARGHKEISFDEVRGHIGEGFSPFIRSLAEEAGDKNLFETEIFNHFQQIYDQDLLTNTKFYEGAKEFLIDFQDHADTKIGIVSNKPEYQVRLILKSLGIDEKHLVEIFGGDRFKEKKPNPKPLLEMMRLAKAEPRETVMIGDSRADVEAAKAAGTHFIGVGFGYNTVEYLKSFGADRFISHFEELVSQLRELGLKAE